MKHLETRSRLPRPAQDAELSFAALFTLLSEILLAVSTAVIAKETQDLTDLTGLLGGGGAGTDTGA